VFYRVHWVLFSIILKEYSLKLQSSNNLSDLQSQGNQGSNANNETITYKKQIEAKLDINENSNPCIESDNNLNSNDKNQDLEKKSYEALIQSEGKIS